MLAIVAKTIATCSLLQQIRSMKDDKIHSVSDELCSSPLHAFDTYSVYVYDGMGTCSHVRNMRCCQTMSGRSMTETCGIGGMHAPDAIVHISCTREHPCTRGSTSVRRVSAVAGLRLGAVPSISTKAPTASCSRQSPWRTLGTPTQPPRNMTPVRMHGTLGRTAAQAVARPVAGARSAKATYSADTAAARTRCCIAERVSKKAMLQTLPEGPLERREAEEQQIQRHTADVRNVPHMQELTFF